MFLKGKITGITPNETMPDDSNTDILKDETCFDIQYSKYKSKTYHYRILPDLQFIYVVKLLCKHMLKIIYI
jgi:hypothetical protein